MKTIGILGLGSIGRRHAANIIALGHRVVFHDPAGVMDSKSVSYVLRNSDAVVIASPSDKHLDHMRRCIPAGRHVLVEKPIATKYKGSVHGIVEEAGSRGLVLMVGTNLRFRQCVIKAKEWLGSGVIGKPLWAQVCVAQHTDKPPYLRDGVILNWGAHEVDLALHLLGPAKVACAAADAADTIADIILLHESGCRTHVHLDYLTKPHGRQLIIVGDGGSIHMDVQNNVTVLHPMHSHDGSNHPMHDVGIQSFDQDYVAEMREFIDLIDGAYTHRKGADGWDGLRTLELLLDAKKKAGLK